MRRAVWPALVAGLVVVAIFAAGCGSSRVTQAQQQGDVQSLILALQDQDASVRREAAEALGKLGSAQAVPVLVKTLRDQDSAVRLSTIEALGKIGDPKAVPGLTEALESAQSLGGELLADEQEAAAKALAAIGDARAVKPLVRYASENHDVAVRALVEIGKPAVGPLTEVLEGKARAARTVAAEALGEIGGTRAVKALIASIPVGYSAARDALVQIGKPAAGPLIEALGSEKAIVRSTAAEVLGELGDRRATAGLKAALDDSDAGVWEAASDALALLYRKDVEKLLPLLRASETVHIYYGLIGLGKKGTQADLVTALETYGYEAMAEDYLNSGNAKLEAAARRWADAHGYDITTLPGIVGSTGGWGRLG